MKTILVLLALVSLTIALEKCSNYQCPPQCDNTDDKVCALHESGFLNTYLNPCKACCESGAQTYSFGQCGVDGPGENWQRKKIPNAPALDEPVLQTGGN